MNIAEQVLKGNRLALARLLTLIENNHPDGQLMLDELFPHTGRTFIIGITGPSGSGKSSLVNRLALTLVKTPGEAEANSIAILAIDPSSSFSGGALLGDRIRMRDLMNQPEIFIRSMATRGALGGLARAANEMVLALEAGGFGTILVETAGAGQSEVDIARLAHTTVVVEAPGLGDDIQAAKAGILEIADVLVVNKADKSSADAAARSLSTMLEIGLESGNCRHETDNAHWQVPVIKTSALNGSGIDELTQAIQQHRAYLHTSGEWEKRGQARLIDMFERLLREKLLANWLQKQEAGKYSEIIRKIQQRKISPHQAVKTIFKA